MARREHACVELAAKLRARGFDADEVERAVAELAAAGLVSDQRFCAAFVRERAARGQGPRRIARDLGARGVDEALSAEVLAGYRERWAGLAARARSKRFGAAVPDGYKERARQARFLEGRGYTGEQVRAAFETAAEQQDWDFDDQQ